MVAASEDADASAVRSVACSKASLTQLPPLPLQFDSSAGSFAKAVQSTKPKLAAPPPWRALQEEQLATKMATDVSATAHAPVTGSVGKALPPWRQIKELVEKKEEDEDDDYDPFAEEDETDALERLRSEIGPSDKNVSPTPIDDASFQAVLAATASLPALPAPTVHAEPIDDAEFQAQLAGISQIVQILPPLATGDVAVQHAPLPPLPPLPPLLALTPLPPPPLPPLAMPGHIAATEFAAVPAGTSVSSTAPAPGSAFAKALQGPAVPKAHVQESAVPETPVQSTEPSPEPTEGAAAFAAALRKTDRGTDRRINAGAALAEKYFAHDATHENVASPPEKRRRVANVKAAPSTPNAPSWNFTAELLAKAPSSLQTCRSLLLFLDKKLGAPLATQPAVGGPQEFRVRLEAHADASGRLVALRSEKGWDSRAKRILDITLVAASDSGKNAISPLQRRLDVAEQELRNGLKSSGEDNLEVITKDRRSWAADCLRREWLAWCGRLLRAREIALLGEVENGSDKTTAPQAACNGGTFLDGKCILQALLSGVSGLSSPKLSG